MKPVKRSWISISAGLLFFLLLGIVLERHKAFQHARHMAQTRTVPTAMLNHGPMGELLKQLGVIRSLPNDESLYTRSKEAPPDPFANIFQKKRHVGQLVFEAHPGGAAFPSSSQTMEPETPDFGCPILSLAVESNSLYDVQSGIIANYDKRGRDWECLGSASYYEDGLLRFASGVGLRLHGDKPSHRSKGKNFRLYFRKTCGLPHFVPDVLGPQANPVRTLVLRGNDPHSMRFATPLALDIVRRIGGLAPEGIMVKFAMNGRLKGYHWLGEHLSKRQWRSRFGHDEFDFYRYKSTSDPESVASYAALHEWVRTLPQPISLDQLAQRIDMDNFQRHVLSLAFCATTDWIQGIAVHDRSSPDALWQWISWDMDHSWKHFSKKSGRESWTKKGFGLFGYGEEWLTRPAGPLPIDLEVNLRALLFTRLWKENPEFSNRMIRLTTDMLNHRLTPDFLQSRLDHYVDFHFNSINRRSWEHRMAAFMQHRPDYIRSELQRYFGAGALFSVVIQADDETSYSVDGYAKQGAFEGKYFQNQTIVLHAGKKDHHTFSHWLIHGKSVRGALLSHPVTTNLVITPIFTGP